MNRTTDEAFAQGHAQGWQDACATLAAQMLSTFSTAQYQAPGGQPKILCRECQEPMVIGQPARTVGRDVLNRTVWEHQVCPPKIWTSQPQLKVPAPAPAAEDQEDEQDAPEQAQLAVKLAICGGKPGGPWAIVVRDTDGQWIKRIDLDWDRFRPASAGHRLTEEGWRVLPQAMLDITKAAGWTQVGDTQWSAPVIAWEKGAEEPIPPTTEMPPAVAVVVESDSGSGYSSLLPKRVPGQAMAQDGGMMSVTLELEYLGQDADDNSVTYKVVNAACENCGGLLHLVMVYDPTGQWLREKSMVCQSCGKATTV